MFVMEALGGGFVPGHESHKVVTMSSSLGTHKTQDNKDAKP